jgi:hypothetical protein
MLERARIPYQRSPSGWTVRAAKSGVHVARAAKKTILGWVLLDFCRSQNPNLRSDAASVYLCQRSRAVGPPCPLHRSKSISVGCSYGIVSDPRPVPACLCHSLIRPSIHSFIHRALMNVLAAAAALARTGWREASLTRQARHACQGPRERGRCKCGSARAAWQSVEDRLVCRGNSWHEWTGRSCVTVCRLELSLWRSSSNTSAIA